MSVHGPDCTCHECHLHDVENFEKNMADVIPVVTAEPPKREVRGTPCFVHKQCRGAVECQLKRRGH